MFGNVSANIQGNTTASGGDQTKQQSNLFGSSNQTVGTGSGLGLFSSTSMINTILPSTQGQTTGGGLFSNMGNSSLFGNNQSQNPQGGNPSQTSKAEENKSQTLSEQQPQQKPLGQSIFPLGNSLLGDKKLFQFGGQGSANSSGDAKPFAFSQNTSNPNLGKSNLFTQTSALTQNKDDAPIASSGQQLPKQSPLPLTNPFVSNSSGDKQQNLFGQPNPGLFGSTGTPTKPIQFGQNQTTGGQGDSGAQQTNVTKQGEVSSKQTPSLFATGGSSTSFGNLIQPTSGITSSQFPNLKPDVKKNEEKKNEEVKKEEPQKSSGGLFGANTTSSLTTFGSGGGNGQSASLFTQKKDDKTSTDTQQKPPTSLSIPTSGGTTSLFGQGPSAQPPSSLFGKTVEKKQDGVQNDLFGSLDSKPIQSDAGKKEDQKKEESKVPSFLNQPNQSQPTPGGPDKDKKSFMNLPNIDTSKKEEEKKNDQADASQKPQQQQEPVKQIDAPPQQLSIKSDQKTQEIIENLINKWDKQIKSDEESFKKAQDKLYDYEVVMIQSFDAVKKLEQSAESIKSNYISNLKTLNDIKSEQKMIIDEITNVEKELDELLKHPHARDRVLSIYSLGENKKELSKDQIVNKALDVESEIDSLNQTLLEVESSANSQLQKCRDSFVIINEAYDKKGEKLKIDEILGQFYDSTRWLENCALDLQFQVEEVAQKIELAKTTSY